MIDKNPLDVQVGGNHYKGWKIQPIEFMQANWEKLDPCTMNMIKYACRWREKGKLEDVKKIIHYAELLIQLEKLDVPTTQEVHEKFHCTKIVT